MTNYYQVRLGRGARFVEKCLADGFIGVDYDIEVDLTGRLPDAWRDFNDEFIPIYLESHPDKSKVAAGLACGAIWTVCRGIEEEDIVLCPDGDRAYRVGRVKGGYMYHPEGPLPHRRPVEWLNKVIDRVDMSEALRGSTGTPNTTTNLEKYAEEIETLLGGVSARKLITTDDTIEDPSAFAMEKHLEDFLVQNWQQSELGRDYDIFTEDSELVGQQFPTDTGPIDILAVSKDKQELLVIELKKGRASDVVVGQILRYIGFVTEELAEPGQTVRGSIIALEDSQRLRRALVTVSSVDFYRYQIHFSLVKERQ